MIGKYLQKKLSRTRTSIEFKGQISHIPENIILMITVQRSGSTWLLDCLRSHPFIDLHSKADTWAFLKLHGRRYPRDLSNNSDGGFLVEVEPKTWEKVPYLKAPTFVSNEEENSQDGDHQYWFVEKIHPHFFVQNIEDFLYRLDFLTRNKRVFFLYQIRRPQEVLASFLNYQERNPRWYAGVNKSRVFDLLVQDYSEIYRMMIRHPGMCITYDQMTFDFNQTMMKIFSSLDLGTFLNDDSENNKLVRHIQKITSENKSQRQTALFLSDSSPSQNKHQDYSHWISSNDLNKLKQCNSYYKKIQESCIL